MFHGSRNIIFSSYLWCGFNEYPQSVFFTQNENQKNVYPYKPHFSLYKLMSPGAFSARTYQRNLKDPLKIHFDWP